MKIHVAKMGEETIEGYRHTVVSDNYINFMDVSNNECSEIMANDVLESFSSDKIKDCIISLVNKLRLGGKLVVGGKDLRLFCKSVTNGTMSQEEASNILMNVNSMSSLSLVRPIVESLGLKVITTQISGVHFELTAQRG